ncbi:ATP-dependent RNA helicase ddx3x [Tritrichomonas musculus]|uniref:RNA helicase n=1 Tax=Tritrichomonas musculus TaxID=1915356 RepID=A0ABR2HFP3_9EUKA
MAYIPPHLRKVASTETVSPPSNTPAPPPRTNQNPQQRNMAAHPYASGPLPSYNNSNNNQNTNNYNRGYNNYRNNNFRNNSNRYNHVVITDEQIEQMFEANTISEDSDMSVYEDAQVTVTSNFTIQPISGFPRSGIDNLILYNVASQRYKSPTSVQKYAIPYILNGRDVIVTAQTGSGKTAAFMLPVLTMILDQPRSRVPYVVSLVPTRELAIQIYKETQKFCGQSPIKTVLVYGGENIKFQLNQFRYGCDILIATPGRLIDIMNHGELSLANVQLLILDEADRMLDMGFQPQISHVIQNFDMPPPQNRQTLLFSATFPDMVKNLALEYMKKDITRIEVGMQDAPSLIEQRFIYVPDRFKLSKLMEIIGDTLVYDENTDNGTTIDKDKLLQHQTLVFAERRNAVDNIEDFLYEEGCHVVAIHGERDMENRQAALRGFTNGKAQIMVATDVAARGLDIPNVSHIINLDLPTDLDTYTHRIGRTGRAGKKGLATSFWNENNVNFLNNLINHLHEARLPIPEGLEEYEEKRNSSYRQQRNNGSYANRKKYV